MLGSWPTNLMSASAVICLVLIAVNERWTGLARILGGRLHRHRYPMLASIAVLGAALIAFLGSLGPVGLRDFLAPFARLAIGLLKWPWLPGWVAVAALAVLVVILDARAERLRGWLLVRSMLLRPRLIRTGRTARGPLAFAVAIAVISVVGWPQVIRPLFRAEPPNAEAYNYREPYYLALNGPGKEVSRLNFRPGKAGLTLDPHTPGEIVYRLERSPESLVWVKLDFYNQLWEPPGQLNAAIAFPNRVEVSTDGGETYRTLAENTSFGELIADRPGFDLTPVLGATTTYYIRLSANNTTDQAAAVLALVMVNTVVDPAGLPPPALPDLAWLIGGALLAYLMATRLRWVWWQSAVLGSAVLLLGTLLWQIPALTGGVPQVVFWVALLAATLAKWPVANGQWLGIRGTWAVWRRQNRTTDSHRIVQFWHAICAWWAGDSSRATTPSSLLGAAFIPAAVAIVLVGIDIRWAEMMEVRLLQLPPDAAGYKSYADLLPADAARLGLPPWLMFYIRAFGVREPLWIFLVRWTFDLLGSSVFHLRLLSVVLSVGVVAATIAFARARLGPLTGLLAGLLLAINPVHITNSVLGLREELGTLLFLAVIALLCHRAPGAQWSWPLLAGVAAAAMVLTRSEVQFHLLVLLAVGGRWVAQWSWRGILVSWIVMIVLIVPMYGGFYYRTGDPFFPANYGATVNRNLEFQERIGKDPGFPTREEYERGGWAAGPKITPMEYFFGYHTVSELAIISLRGYGYIFTQVLLAHDQRLLWLFVLGIVLLLAKRRWIIPLVILWALAPPYSFLAGTGAAYIFPGRYAHHALPYVNAAIAWSLVAPGSWLARRAWQRLRPELALSSTPDVQKVVGDG